MFEIFNKFFWIKNTEITKMFMIRKFFMINFAKHLDNNKWQCAIQIKPMKQSFRINRMSK